MTAQSSQNSPPENPYVGPRALQRGEPIFGRQREILQLRDLLIAERIVVCYAPSGAGKSSLINAGLIPELEKENLFHIYPPLRVGWTTARGATQNPYSASLINALEAAQPPAARIASDELQSFTLNEYFSARRILRGDQPANADLADLLIIDQFEEILTLDPGDVAGRTAFFEELGAALRSHQRWALFALREDYLAALDPYRFDIPTRLTNRFRLELLDESGALAAIQGPASSRDRPFEDDAAAQLTDNLRTQRVVTADGEIRATLGPHVEPVQLQVVCRRIWSSLSADATTINLAAVEARGNVDTALADYYADQTKSIAHEQNVNERVVRQWIEANLISESGIRRQTLPGPELKPNVIEALVDAHLLRRDSRAGAMWLELAHDRLIEPVLANNQAWFEAHLSLLQRQAALWEAENRAPDLLLTGASLTEVEAWAVAHVDDLSPRDKDFLTACQAAHQAAYWRARQNARIRRLAIIASAAFIVALFAFGAVFFFFQSATRAGNEARSRELAAAAVANRQINPELGVLLAVRALETFDTSEARSALHDALSVSRVESSHEFDADFTATDISQDSEWMAGGEERGLIHIFDLNNGAELNAFELGESISALKFSPDKQLIAVGLASGAIALIDTQSWATMRQLSGDETPISSLDFSHDGSQLAGGSNSGVTRLWSLRDRTEQPISAATILSTPVEMDHGSAVVAIDFSPDTEQLAIAGEDSKVSIWDIDGGQPLILKYEEYDLNLGYIDAQVRDILFLPEGRVVAAGQPTNSTGTSIKIWDTEQFTAQPLQHSFSSHSDSVLTMAATVDGRLLASGGADGSIWLWDTVTGQSLFTVGRHQTKLTDLFFSMDGTGLISIDNKQVVKRWNARPELIDELPGYRDHVKPVYSLAINDDNTLLASAGTGGRVLIRDKTSGKRFTIQDPQNFWVRLAFSPHDDLIGLAGDSALQIWAITDREKIVDIPVTEPLTDIVFSPTENVVVIADTQGVIRVLDAYTGEEVISTKVDTQVNGIAFTPDGEHLAAGAADGRVLIWDMNSQQVPEVLYQHGDEITAVAYSADGQYLAATTRDWVALLWRTQARSDPMRLTGHQGRVTSLSFNADGTELATGSYDGTARLWDLNNGRMRLALRGHGSLIAADGQVLDVAYTPDGETLMTAGNDTSIRVYALDTQALRNRARALVPRQFTPEECRQYNISPCPQ